MHSGYKLHFLLSCVPDLCQYRAVSTTLKLYLAYTLTIITLQLNKQDRISVRIKALSNATHVDRLLIMR